MYYVWTVFVYPIQHTTGNKLVHVAEVYPETLNNQRTRQIYAVRTRQNLWEDILAAEKQKEDWRLLLDDLGAYGGTVRSKVR